MKALFLSILLIASFNWAQADEDFLETLDFARKSCAGNTNEINKISDFLGQVSPWGTWTGKWKTDNLVMTFSKKSGIFKGNVKKGSSNYGPYNVTLCDYGNKYTGIVLGYEAEFVILSSKKLKVISPFNSKDEIIVTKTKSE